ncbi:MAG: DUF1700 domain-containing protein [Clostridiales bacterium]|nr:DUF1700 domain-containing protein [Clostridiales bacterium]
MTYNEWRDELKNNLLSVSDAERRRVLDYYAEAYADRREAGFSEREIIADFGAPYDAAQRILCESEDETYSEPPKTSHYGDSREARREERREERRDSRSGEYREPCPVASDTRTKKREDYTWVFVLLCIIFAGPLFGLVMTMVGVTIGLGVAPFGVLVAGIGRVCVGIGGLFSGVSGGLLQIGLGLIQTGISIVLFPLCFWLIRLMWKLFRKLFRWIRSLFSGREVA